MNNRLYTCMQMPARLLQNVLVLKSSLQMKFCRYLNCVNRKRMRERVLKGVSLQEDKVCERAYVIIFREPGYVTGVQRTNECLPIRS